MHESLPDRQDVQSSSEGFLEAPSEDRPQQYWEVVTSLPYGPAIHYALDMVPIYERLQSFKMKDLVTEVFGVARLTEDEFFIFRDSVIDFPGIRRRGRKYIVRQLFEIVDIIA